MRKFLYLLCIFCLGGILIYQGFFVGREVQKSSFDSLDFTDTGAIFQLSEKNGDITQKKLLKDEVLALPKNDIVYEKMDMVDGVYREAGTTINISKGVSKNTEITLGTGSYIFAINNLFETYTISGYDISIQPKTPGYFFIQNAQGSVRVYSYNSILSINLLTDKKLVTNFHLFPSLLFSYNPEYNNTLLHADMLRIATINSVIFVSANTPSAFIKISGGTSRSKKDVFHLLQIGQLHIKKQLGQHQLLFEDLIKNRVEDLNGSNLIENYPFLFVNDSKKDIFLKNRLAQELAKIFESQKNSSKLESTSETFMTAVRAFKDSSPTTLREGINMLKLYAQISFLATNPLAGKDQEAINLFSTALKELDPTFVPENQTLSALSRLFLTHQFREEEKNVGFEKTLNTYLTSIIANKQGFQQEFSFFSFFLGQYIITDAEINEDIFSIVNNFITISNITFDSLGNSKTIRKTYLDSILFTYEKITSQLKDGLLTTFFDTTPKGLLIKDEFLSSNLVQQNIIDIDSFKNFITYISRDLDKKKTLFYEYNGPSQPGIKDLYMSSVESITALNHVYTILTDYSTYRQNLELDPLNQAASRLSLDDNKPLLSLQALQTYLSQFNGLQVNTIQVSNNFLVDNFYLVRVIILDRVFNFRLNPVGNVIDGIKITDAAGGLIKETNLSVSLDEKEKWLKDLYTSEEDPVKKYQYDFKNFFEVSYLSAPGRQINSSDNSGSNKEMTPQMKVFVQQNLLDGDFKFLNEFLAIPATSIFTTIEDGEYHTELSKIPKYFPGKDDGYQTEISGFYVFAKHSFYKLTLAVKEQDRGYRFGGYNIEILPNYITTQDAEKLLKPIGKYLEIIEANYTSNTKDLKIDLNSHTVSINSQTFNVIY